MLVVVSTICDEDAQTIKDLENDGATVTPLQWVLHDHICGECDPDDPSPTCPDLLKVRAWLKTRPNVKGLSICAAAAVFHEWEEKHG